MAVPQWFNKRCSDCECCRESERMELIDGIIRKTIVHFCSVKSIDREPESMSCKSYKNGTRSQVEHVTVVPWNNQKVNLISDIARAHFIQAGLTYDDIGSKEWYLLKNMVEDELIDFIFYADADVIQRLYVDDKSSRKHKSTMFVPDEKGGTKFSQILVNGPYFERREGITFNTDGFIGFSGWAATKNMVPFVNAFHKWLNTIRPEFTKYVDESSWSLEARP